MQTFSGRKFYPNDIRVSDICIEDIAHALSHVCRFGGHCNRFYSVAQHSVHVAEIVEERCSKMRPMLPRTMEPAPLSPVMARQFIAHALLHDAAEAYLGDCVTPLKQVLPDYRDVEERAMNAILGAFPVGVFAPDITKDADRVMLVTEARDLLGSPPWIKNYEQTPLKQKIVPWSPETAKLKFLMACEKVGVK